MIFYHRTAAEAAHQILRDGFRDGVGTYLTDQVWSGVWISNVPLDVNEGAEGDTLLQLEGLEEAAITDFEWIEDGKAYREWLVRARLLNEQAKITVVDEA